MGGLMKTIKLFIFCTLSIFLLCSHVVDYNQQGEKKDNSRTLLILEDPLTRETFSVFDVVERNGILVGVNVDQDYPVANGIYIIKGSSNDNFRQRTILIVD